MKKIIYIEIFYICLLLLFPGNFACNYVPEFNDISTNFIPNEDHFFKYDSLYFINPTPGYKVLFRGIRKRTTRKHDSSPLIEEDSIFYRWTTNPKTIKNCNGQTFGTFDFSKADIYNWNRILETMKSPFTPFGEIIPDYMDKEIFDSLITKDSVSTFSSTDSNNILKTIKDMIADKHLYQKYREKIREYIAAEDILLSHLNTELSILITKKIFIDTSGTASSSLSENDKEELKWFNRLLLSRFSTDLNFRAFIKYPAAAKQVFSVTFEQGLLSSNLDNRKITRYLTFNNKTMRQFVFNEGDYEFITPDLTDTASVLHSFYFNSRTQYPVTSLFAPSDIPFIKASEFPDVMIPGKAIFSLLKYSKIGDTLYYNMKLYYPIFGTIYRDDKPVDISGTITMLAHFYKISLVNTGDDQGYFTDWRTDIAIRKKNINGKVESFSETRLLTIEKKGG